jgi:Skp family chaperone for outer membrane proteins
MEYLEPRLGRSDARVVMILRVQRFPAVDTNRNGVNVLNKLNLTQLIVASLLAVGMTGCEQMRGAGGGASTAVIDLEAIAKATGQDAVFEQEMTAVRQDLNQQITAVAAELESQLADEKVKFGDPMNEEEQQLLQQLTMQAQQQLSQRQAQAQQQAQQYQMTMVTEFRNKVQPIAAEIAAGRGADMILISDPAMLWFDPSIDMTEEVIGALRDRKVQFSADSAVESVAAPDPAPAPEIIPATE